MFRHVLFALPLAIVGAPAFVVASDDRPETIHDGIARLFQIGDPVSLRATDDATSYFETLDKAMAADWRAKYAFVLVLAHQRKYHDALSRIDMLVNERPKDVDLLRTRIWLQIVLRKHQAALADISRLAMQLPGDQTDPIESQRAADLAEFSGRMMAFLEGPVGGKIKPALVLREKNKLIQQMPESLRAAFDRGLEEVLAIHRELEDEIKEAKAALETGERQSLEKERSALQNELAEKQADRDKLEKRSESSSKRADDKLSDVNSRGRSVESQLSSLQATAAPLVAQMEDAWRQGDALRAEAAIAYSQAQQLNAQAADLERQGNRAEAARLRREAAQMSSIAAQSSRGAMLANNSAARLQSRLLPLQSQAMQLTGQRDALLGERASLLDRADREQQQLDDKAEELEQDTAKLKKRVAAATKKQPAKSNARLRVLNSQKESISTYEEFPFELERDRLLAGFGKVE